MEPLFCSVTVVRGEESRAVTVPRPKASRKSFWSDNWLLLLLVVLVVFAVCYNLSERKVAQSSSPRRPEEMIGGCWETITERMRTGGEDRHLASKCTSTLGLEGADTAEIVRKKWEAWRREK